MFTPDFYQSLVISFETFFIAAARIHRLAILDSSEFRSELLTEAT